MLKETLRTRTRAPGICGRAIPGCGLLPGVPEAASPPQLLVEALDPVEAGAGEVRAQQRRVGRQRRATAARGGGPG